MTGILLAVTKIAYLGLLWLFILFVANTVRRDLSGRTLSTRDALLATLDQSSQPSPPPEQAMASQPQDQDMTPPWTQPGAPALQHLALISGNQLGTRLTLPGALVLGRATGSGFDIDDDYASGQHARLYRQADGRWVIEDLQSTNGTYVNGARISAPTFVGEADVIRIGRTQLKLER